MNLPQINAGNQNLAQVTEEAWAAIREANKSPYLFRYGELLCRLERDNGTCSTKPLTNPRLRHELARVATWFRRTRNGKQEAKPPNDVVTDMLATPNAPLPKLSRITKVPVFAADGTLQSESGYHEVSQVYYAPTNGFAVDGLPNEPTPKQIVLARNLIFKNLLADFPFVSKADRAHTMALFLLPFARDLIDGATPNHLIESPTPGSGKDLLADVCLRAALGGTLGIIAQANNDEEWRKRITACLREGKGAIFIGNITKPLDSGVVALALTTHTWSDRVLGKNEMFQLPVRCIWVTTGNNPTVSTEIARRSIRIRLDAGVERPWERKDFKYPNLRGWADGHRTQLVRAALILIRAWVVAGMPRWNAKSLGSYEQWSAVMGGILENAGIEGFLDNLEEFYEVADVEGACWEEFVGRWWEAYEAKAVSVADLVEIAQETGIQVNGATSSAQRVSLGMQLTKRRDQVIAGCRLLLAGKVQGSARWKLVSGKKVKV
jgi:hypothetical protein